MIKLSNIFLFLGEYFASFINVLYQLFGRLFNYPNNPGMPVIKPDNVISYFGNQYEKLYPRYVPPISMDSIPQSWLETITGKLPNVGNAPKFFYQSYESGFYSFYIDIYSNNYFLPDWLSKWLQLTFNIGLDTTNLEAIQQAIFVFLIIYINFISFRITLFWFITINPFIRPWIYITSLVDWAYDITAGLTPGILGIDFGLVIFLGLLGKLLDFINGLIFTMPFLPSEGERDILTYTYIDPDVPFLSTITESKSVIFFRYLPKLWYTHRIPNEIREYWFSQRPEILKYMIDHYERLGVPVYPDSILKIFEQEGLPITLPLEISDLGTILTTGLMFNDHSFFLDILNNNQ